MAKINKTVEEVILNEEEKKALELKQVLLDEFQVKATKENWRIIKNSNKDFTCQCLINGEYIAVYSANSLGLANVKVREAIEEFKSRIECIDGPVVVVDFSIPEVKPETNL